MGILSVNVHYFVLFQSKYTKLNFIAICCPYENNNARAQWPWHSSFKSILSLLLLVTQYNSSNMWSFSWSWKLVAAVEEFLQLLNYFNNCTHAILNYVLEFPALLRRDCCVNHTIWSGSITQNLWGLTKYNRKFPEHLKIYLNMILDCQINIMLLWNSLPKIAKKCISGD